MMRLLLCVMAALVESRHREMKEEFALVMLPAPAQAIELSSAEGFEILKRSLSRSYRQVSIHLTTQDTESLCAIASAVAVLNAMSVDMISQTPVDPIYEPYPYWTQSVLAGDECLVEVHDPAHGSTRTQLVDMLSQCLPIHVQNIGAPDDLNTLRSLLIDALADNNADSHVLVNFERTDLVDEVGGGHFSPIVAYDAEEDLVLMLDVARYKYPPLWFKLEDLWASTRRFDPDSNESRGFIFMSPRPMFAANSSENK